MLRALLRLILAEFAYLLRDPYDLDEQKRLARRLTIAEQAWQAGGKPLRCTICHHEEDPTDIDTLVCCRCDQGTLRGKR
jgi:hypothetical protein